MALSFERSGSGYQIIDKGEYVGVVCRREVGWVAYSRYETTRAAGRTRKQATENMMALNDEGNDESEDSTARDETEECPHGIPYCDGCERCEEPDDYTVLKHFVQRNQQAIELAIRYGGIDGGHHKAWVIDQVVRILAGDDYLRIIAAAKSGEDGPDTYGWDEGIAP